MEANERLKLIGEKAKEVNAWLDGVGESTVTIGDVKRWIAARWPDLDKDLHRAIVFAVLA